MDDAKARLGLAIRAHRESLQLSQEKLAERAHITYQYLSAIENGRENFTIGVLESLAIALGIRLPALVSAAYEQPEQDTDYPRIDPAHLRRVPLPPDLTLEHVADSLNDTQRIVHFLNRSLLDVSGRTLPSYIQANNFSGIVSNILTDAFDRLTPYKHNHDQRYPDLINHPWGLEIKTTIRVGKGGESHNGHSGWHLVACFKLYPDSGDILFIHTMFADLIGHIHADSDWKYVGSSVNRQSGSQRTETYSTTPKGTTKLRDGSAYLDPSEIPYRRWRRPPTVPIPEYSISYRANKARSRGNAPTGSRE